MECMAISSHYEERGNLHALDWSIGQPLQMVAFCLQNALQSLSPHGEILCILSLDHCQE